MSDIYAKLTYDVKFERDKRIRDHIVLITKWVNVFFAERPVCETLTQFQRDSILVSVVSNYAADLVYRSFVTKYCNDALRRMSLRHTSDCDVCYDDRYKIDVLAMKCCRQRVCVKCIRDWSESREIHNEDPTCPFCRSADFRH